DGLPPSLIEVVREVVFYLKVPIFTTTCEELGRLQDLFRHQLPSGDPAAIVAHALSQLLKDMERRRWARTDAARATSGQSSTRYVPAFVRREVWQRDGG